MPLLRGISSEETAPLFGTLLYSVILNDTPLSSVAQNLVLP